MTEPFQRLRVSLVATLLGVALAGAASAADPAPEDATTADDAPQAAIAVLRQASGSSVYGVVYFEPADDGVRVKSEVHGLPAGTHAYHVHLYGDCSAKDASSAGTHFNFSGPSKTPPADIDRITGNLGELVSEGGGVVYHQAVVERATLTGAKSILGRSVVVHERGNDPSKPPIGDAGGRIACGVIGADEPTGLETAQQREGG